MEMAAVEIHLINNSLLTDPTLKAAENNDPVESLHLIAIQKCDDLLDADAHMLNDLSNVIEDEGECSNLDTHDKKEMYIVDELINHFNTLTDNLTNSNAIKGILCEIENSNYVLKSEIEIEEVQVGFQTEKHKSKKPAELQINLEKLSYGNQSHKKAIENLPNLIIRLKRLDARIIKKVDKYGFVKPSDLLPPRPRRKSPYPKGLKEVVFEKGKFDKRALFNAYRRGAKIDDKGGFLKYQCPTCTYKTWSFNALSKHHSGLHGFKIKWTVSCPDCDFTATNESRMARHQQSHKAEPDLSCPQCPYITRFDVALRTHLRRWHLPDKESKTLRCPNCNYVSVCKTTYDAHLMVHFNRRETYLSRFVHNSVKNKEAQVLKCEYCKFQSLDKNSLRVHMQQTHKIKDPFKKELYRCKKCGLETKHRFSFRDHMLIHKKVEDFSLLQCYDCGFKTKWRKLLVVHLRTEHAKPEQQKETVYYHCAECEKKFPRKYLLKTHIFKQHKESETLICHDCNYTTKIMASLRRHTLTQHIHPKKKIYQCQRCYLISEDKEKHKAHLRTHKYECYKCGYQTLNKETLRYHIVGHMSKKIQETIVKIYRCQSCGYKTRDKHIYLRHMKRWGHQPAKLCKNKIGDSTTEKDKPI